MRPNSLYLEWLNNSRKLTISHRNTTDAICQKPRIRSRLLHEEYIPHQQIVLTTVPDVTEDSAQELIPGSG